jgi:hypothetical protein
LPSNNSIEIQSDTPILDQGCLAFPNPLLTGRLAEDFKFGYVIGKKKK